jgi:hypothetical protein
MLQTVPIRLNFKETTTSQQINTKEYLDIILQTIKAVPKDTYTLKYKYFFRTAFYFL